MGDATFIHSLANGEARPDGTIVVVLRPEKIQISEKAPDKKANRVAGKIQNWNYFGTTLHFIVRTEEIGEVTVDIPAWRNLVKPEPGKQVWLTWDPDATVVVADDDRNP